MFDSQSDLAALVYDPPAAPDGLLKTFATQLTTQGFRPAGLIQFGAGCASTPAFSVRLVHSGEQMSLVEERGPEARGCRLDVSRLLDAGMLTSQVLKDGADLLIVNRYGKQEAEGKGLLFLIEEAVALDIPVLIAVPRERLDAWIAFAQGMSVLVHGTLDSLQAWWTGVSVGKTVDIGNARVGECHGIDQPMRWTAISRQTI